MGRNPSANVISNINIKLDKILDNFNKLKERTEFLENENKKLKEILKGEIK